MLGKEETLDAQRAELARRERGVDDRARRSSARRQSSPTSAPRAGARARARRRRDRRAGQAAAAEGARGPGPPRLGEARSARSRRRPSATPTGACATSSPSCMQRIAAGHATETTVSVVQLALRRHEGPHHRPRGPQHPRAREPHRRRLHHRRHAQRGRPVRLRRRPPRDRPHDAREAARRTGASTRRGSRRCTTRPSPSSKTTSSSWGRRPCFEANVQGLDPELIRLLGRLKLPHQLRAERARALGRVLAAWRR